MTEAEFRALAAQGYNRIPLVLESFADLDTPLSLYLKLANQPYSYLLESVQGGERFGRYSIVGLPARMIITVRGNRVEVTQDGHLAEAAEVADPLQFLEAFQKRYRIAPPPGELRFVGGLVGFLGYDVARYVEVKLGPATKPDPLGLPDIQFLFSDEIAVVDNVASKLSFIVYVDPAERHAYAMGQARLERLRDRLREPVRPPESRGLHGTVETATEFPRERFLAAVAKCKEYILAGDMMQVQISQRISRPFAAPPINLYRALRSVNPSPYMFYFDMATYHIVGASPEILVRQEGEKVTVRPIAGTRRRGRTPDDDLAMAKELSADPKERAEHVMLIDLGRNDIGRVAEIGTVKVTETMIVERYSHVMHLVSNVDAKLRAGVTTWDLLRATFPAGTVTGAPKIRAMEIIDELEPTKRGLYAGAVGYIGFNGNMDMAIAIRTAIVKDKVLYVQAAAGIVADSIPENEWEETNSKARAVLRAAELAMQPVGGINS